MGPGEKNNILSKQNSKFDFQKKKKKKCGTNENHTKKSNCIYDAKAKKTFNNIKMVARKKWGKD